MVSRVCGINASFCGELPWPCPFPPSAEQLALGVPPIAGAGAAGAMAGAAPPNMPPPITARLPAAVAPVLCWACCALEAPEEEEAAG